MALLTCMGLFLFPMSALASDKGSPDSPDSWAGSFQSEQPAAVAPPTVEAEIIGSLLRIHTIPGFYEVEAVYVNGRRFNHRVDSALVIDISGYIADGETIAVHAVDFAGNHSNTVLLSPPMPAQPPVPNNITPEGQGEVLDHLTGEDRIELVTVNTPAGNVFYLVIDHTRASNNVYLLNPVTEWDLLTLAEDAELAAPPHIAGAQPTEPAITEREPVDAEPPEPEPEPEQDEDDSGGSGIYIFLAIAGVGAFGVIYYIKILKPKKEREMYGGGDDNYGDYDEVDGFEDIDDDSDDVNENDVDSNTDSDDEGDDNL